MKKVIATMIACMSLMTVVQAQERTVENRPYTDLRPFHFGVFVGTHMQDIELMNAGPQTVTAEDGTTRQVLISADQDRWDPGFTVGVLGELRLNTYLQLRLAPAMYFGNRHITYLNHTDLGPDGQPITMKQDLKTAYVSAAFNLIAAGPRFNNHRPYVMAGINPMINLSGKDEDILKLKRFDAYLEIGIGCDFYLPFFKLRPELKFMYSLTDSYEKSHVDHMRDANLIPYAKSIKESRSKIIALTFYFE
jgi:hypothetical protein